MTSTFGTAPQIGLPVQQPSPMPFNRYTPFVPIDLPDRTWAARKITHAPRWLSTDLRDGNQALIDPMTPSRKLRMFELLVGMGYKEIEIGFPSASQTDFDFVRKLITEDRVPRTWQISVLTQAREDLISRTAESLVGGAPREHPPCTTRPAELFRRVVFRISEGRVRRDGEERHATGHEVRPRSTSRTTQFGYQYSPEIFTQTPTDFAIEICNEVMDIWQAGRGPRDHPQPAGDRRALHGRTRTPTRSSTSAGT